MTKECFKCGVIKPLTDFYKHPRMKDGRFNKCKECNKKDVRKNRKDKIDYYRSYDAGRYKNDPSVKQRISKAASDWNARHPDRYKAHYLLNNAVRDGRLMRPDQCQECGVTGRLHGHHHDYTKPLDVEWLCPPCHFARHQ